MKPFLAYSEALYLKPLLYGLEGNDSPFERVVDFPSAVAMNLNKSASVESLAGKRIRLEGAGCAFLSPLDYARHGAEYCIVPAVAVSSSLATDTVQLFMKSDVRNIKTMAVDIRVTSEIILAKIILAEKYPNEELEHGALQIVPMMPDVNAMLAKADAALIVSLLPSAIPQTDAFRLDLVEEWADLTDLPYVHGFWVGREDQMLIDDAQRLMRAKEEGVGLLDTVAEETNTAGPSAQATREYLSAFSYDFGEPQEESVKEFMSYAFYFGILPDIPEINFFDVEDSPKRSRN